MMEKVFKKDVQAEGLSAGSAEIAVRKAGVGDVEAIFALVNEFARRGEMLARPIVMKLMNNLTEKFCLKKIIITQI